MFIEKSIKRQFKLYRLLFFPPAHPDLIQDPHVVLIRLKVLFDVISTRAGIRVFKMFWMPDQVRYVESGTFYKLITSSN